MLRLANVSFMNARPLIHGLEDLGEQPAGRESVLLESDLPSRLAARLESGQVDAALVPVVEVFRGRAASLVPGVAIACRGPVASVQMFHTGAVAGLKRVRVDRGSRSSVALLRILLREVHGIEPEFLEVEPVVQTSPAEDEADLVIGDRCFAFQRDLVKPGRGRVRVFDLGQEWMDFSGLPFVFAAWAVSSRFQEEASPGRKEQLVRVLQEAKARGLNDVAAIARREAAAGHLGCDGEATEAAVMRYFREFLSYDLGPEEQAGLNLFHRLCVEHGVAPAGNPPSFL